MGPKFVVIKGEHGALVHSMKFFFAPALPLLECFDQLGWYICGRFSGYSATEIFLSRNHETAIIQL
jgi:hypothetical protein